MMRKLLTCLFLLTLIPSGPAQASFWIECKVDGTVIESKMLESQKWELTVKIDKATTMDGHVPTGQNCKRQIKENPATMELELEQETAFAPEDKIRLKYNYYNGMGPEGVVESESWSLWPE